MNILLHNHAAERILATTLCLTLACIASLMLPPTTTLPAENGSRWFFWRHLASSSSQCVHCPAPFHPGGAHACEMLLEHLQALRQSPQPAPRQTPHSHSCHSLHAAQYISSHAISQELGVAMYANTCISQSPCLRLCKMIELVIRTCTCSAHIQHACRNNQLDIGM